MMNFPSGFWEVKFSDLINALVAAAALLVAYVSLRTADKAGRNDVLAQVREWGGEVVDLIADLIGLSTLDPHKDEREFFLRRCDLISRSSALWDRGRFFFPNTYRRHYGVSKEEAFRGVRPPILDLLALIHGMALSMDYKSGHNNNMRRLALVLLKRVFVSAIQRATNFSAPKAMSSYEKYLTIINVECLPEKVRTLANLTGRSFELCFDASIALTDDAVAAQPAVQTDRPENTGPAA